jgi:TRAP-type mannitol/chloroaromatic compound transport system substrate-binding protein
MAMHWAGLHPVAPLFNVMIGGPTAMGHFYWFQVGPGLDLMNEMWEKVGLNVKGVAVIAQEEEVFLYMDRPILTGADLKGLKLRLFADEAAVFVKEFGIVPVGVPSPELYEAMARGVVDGFQHGHLMVDWRMGFYELVDYVYISSVRQPASTMTIIVNRDVWAELPDDLRLLAETVFWKYGARHNAIMTSGTIEYAKKWIDAGIPLLPVPAEIEAAVLRGAAALYAERAARDPFYARVYESISEWAANYKATFPRL